jgi:hypothetical protein
MKYTTVRNAQWANEAHTAIDCEVNFEDIADEFVPFTAVPEGDYPYTHAIFAECVEGKWGVVSEFVPPPPAPPVVPESITRRQCALQLLAMGMITGPEAVAMTRDGTPPAMVQAYIDALPEAEKYRAEIDFAAVAYFRANPLLESIMAASGSTPEQLDQFFVAAAAL